MRTFRHWTIRYISNRIKEIIYRKRYLDYPWLTESANEILERWFKNSDVGLEYGSGRSTLWFAKRVRAFTSVEHNQFWYEKVSHKLKECNISNVTYLLFKNEQGQNNEQESEYVRVVKRFSKNSLDFVLVDGIYRDFCANAVVEYIRPGGILIIDNANWFLPSDSISPSSRTFKQGPLGSQWENFLNSVKNWRCLWTSSGVTDTAIYIKPCHE